MALEAVGAYMVLWVLSEWKDETSNKDSLRTDHALFPLTLSLYWPRNMSECGPLGSQTQPHVYGSTFITITMVSLAGHVASRSYSVFTVYPNPECLE